MATETAKSQCITCGKNKRAVKCEGCSQIFCFNHIADHQQELSRQLDEIEINRDIFRQTLNEQKNNPERHPLIKQIDQWEEDSIRKIQQTAKKCRHLLFQHTTEHINRLEISLAELTSRLREIVKKMILMK